MDYLLDLLSKYIMKVYKCPCSDAWEQGADMLHSYSVASAYCGLKSALDISKALGVGIDDESINEAIYSNDGIKDFLNSLFVKEGILRKSRPEFGSDVIENPKVDASAYIIFAIFDDNHYLVDEDIYANTMKKLEENHTFISQDGKKAYNSIMPKRYEGDKYFGGSGWILLAALESYLSLKDGNHAGASTILNKIEELLPSEGFMLPEQESIDPELLNPVHEGINDSVGKTPAKDLLWSAAEYLRAASKEIEMSGNMQSKIDIRR